MYEEIYEHSPNQIGKAQIHIGTMQTSEADTNALRDGFQCHHCQAYVYTLPIFRACKTGTTAHTACGHGMWTIIKPGDRMSACKAIMQPIGLTVKRSQNKYASGAIR